MNIINELMPTFEKVQRVVYSFEENGKYGLLVRKRFGASEPFDLSDGVPFQTITPAIWDEICVKAVRMDETGPLYLMFKFFVRKGSFWYVMSDYGTLLKNLCFSHIETSVMDDGRNFFGIENTPEISKISPDVIVEKDGKKGVLTSGGSLLVPMEYDSIERCPSPIDNESYRENYIVQKNNLYGMYDAEGELLIPIEYEKIDFVETGLLLRATYVVRKNGKLGTLNAKDGKIVVPSKWDGIEYIMLYNYMHERPRGCLFKVFSNQKCGIYDQRDLIIPPVWDEIVAQRTQKLFDPNCFHVRDGNMWGVYSRWGKCICEAKWDEIGPFINGIARVRSGSNIAYMNTCGEIFEADTPINSSIPEQLQSVRLPNGAESSTKDAQRTSDNYMTYDGNSYSVKLDEDDMPWFFLRENEDHNALVTSPELATQLYKRYREVVRSDSI